MLVGLSACVAMVFWIWSCVWCCCVFFGVASVVVWVCFVLALIAVAFVVFINCCGLADFFLRGFVRVRLVVWVVVLRLL